MMTIIRPIRGTALSMTLLAGATLAACATPEAPEDLIGIWTEPAPATAELVLDEGGTLHGTDGCNQLSGAWSTDADTIIFEQVAITMRACLEMDTWLGALSTATVDGGVSCTCAMNQEPRSGH